MGQTGWEKGAGMGAEEEPEEEEAERKGRSTKRRTEGKMAVFHGEPRSSGGHDSIAFPGIPQVTGRGSSPEVYRGISGRVGGLFFGFFLWEGGSGRGRNVGFGPHRFRNRVPNLFRCP